MQKKMLTAINAMSKQQNIILTKIIRMEKSSIKHERNVIVDAAVIETMSKYFPIDDENKTFVAVEEKLKMERNFFDNVVTFQNMHKQFVFNLSHFIICNIFY